MTITDKLKESVALTHLWLQNCCSPSYSMRTSHSWSKKIQAFIYMCFKPSPIFSIADAVFLRILVFFCCGVPFLTDQIQGGVWAVLLSTSETVKQKQQSLGCTRFFLSCIAYLWLLIDILEYFPHPKYSLPGIRELWASSKDCLMETAGQVMKVLKLLIFVHHGLC